MGCVLILTGERGVGKSTVCRRVVRLARERGYVCGGILTLVEGDDRYVVDVGDGRRRRLTQGSDGSSSVIQGRFRFSAQTLSWGNRTLCQAAPCDLLVIDEVGPLEVERREGWVAAFDVLAAGRFALAILVVRPELVDQVREMFPDCMPEVLTVTRENRDKLARRLLELLDQDRN